MQFKLASLSASSCAARFQVSKIPCCCGGVKCRVPTKGADSSMSSILHSHFVINGFYLTRHQVVLYLVIQGGQVVGSKRQVFLFYKEKGTWCLEWGGAVVGRSI